MTLSDLHRHATIPGLPKPTCFVVQQWTSTDTARRAVPLRQLSLLLRSKRTERRLAHYRCKAPHTWNILI